MKKTERSKLKLPSQKIRELRSVELKPVAGGEVATDGCGPPQPDQWEWT
jgi:hypothetical protein